MNRMINLKRALDLAIAGSINARSRYSIVQRDYNESRYGHLVSEDANREASKLMNQFQADPTILKIQEPLTDDNIDHFQSSESELEISYTYPSHH